LGPRVSGHRCAAWARALKIQFFTPRQEDRKVETILFSLPVSLSGCRFSWLFYGFASANEQRSFSAFDQHSQDLAGLRALIAFCSSLAFTTSLSFSFTIMSPRCKPAFRCKGHRIQTEHEHAVLFFDVVAIAQIGRRIRDLQPEPAAFFGFLLGPFGAAATMSSFDGNSPRVTFTSFFF